MNRRTREIFDEIHAGLPRQGPGDDHSTARALARMTALPAYPRILDVGCGPGAQTLILARLTTGTVTAIDNHQPFLNELERRAEFAALADRVEAINADMRALDFPAGAFDIIWAEGSIYVVGLEAGFEAWRSLLKAGGYLAVTELTWLKTDPPSEVRAFWEGNYPSMQDVECNLKMIRGTGCEIIDCFELPETAWWEEYYRPMEERLESLRRKYKSDDEALALIQERRREIDLYQQFSEYYGYVFYISQVV
jgi:SAM-dependent methyltransferase